IVPVAVELAWASRALRWLTTAAARSVMATVMARRLASTVARAVVRAASAGGSASVTLWRRTGSRPQTVWMRFGAWVVLVVGVWAAPAPAGTNRAMLTAARAPT